MLKIENVTAGYGADAVLQGVTLDVASGQTVALIGPNGAGKTTTMRTISGMIHPRTGTIRLDGKNISGIPANRLARMGVAHVPEGRRVFAPLSVEDNLLLGGYGHLPRLFGYNARARADLDHVFTLFPRLRERRRQPAGTLSGGEQQMLAIGRALMSRPRVLLLDEPSMGLAPVMVHEVFATIAHLRTLGTTILLVEQFAESALKLADYAFVMEGGHVAVSGRASDLAADPRVIEVYLGGDRLAKKRTIDARI
ncbi:MAG: ABC transporter ATP-binding protein [Alphaproteobacteria bacterium]|nr:ABC transporter ATP-binding protein [Alphaproteobacteria bacterium]